MRYLLNPHPFAIQTTRIAMLSAAGEKAEGGDLIRVVDAELLEAVHLEGLEAKDIQDSAHKVDALLEADGRVHLSHKVKEHENVELLRESSTTTVRRAEAVVLDEDLERK